MNDAGNFADASGVIIGATISRLPHSSLAPSGLVELDLAVSVFQKGASQSLRARQGLPYLLKLKERANEAFRLYRDKRTNPSGDFKLQPPEEYYYKDALAIFGGQTRILPTKSKFKSRMQRTSQRSPSLPQSQSSPRESSSSSQHAPSPPSSSSSCQVSTPSDSEATSTPPELHPSLMMYLSQVPSQPPLQTGDMTQLGLEQMIQACPPPVMEHMSMPLPVPPQLDEQLPHTDLDFLGSLLGNPQYQPPPTFGQDVNMQMVSGGFDVPPFANGDVIMSDQWMSLMHETGMLDGVDHFSQETGFPSEMFNF
ncbi:uncharacterized protein FIBRA_04744 [Fibroporia radiculosa]|uniref:Uncharacterized protein n=1 Tax=Fibroporia radiculosa TaxID=599839 RepID=J4GPR4_9APHY|nr:uncharacterized protein FIBRA_04744 [Fibroporia radiculosa]CCM02640.1 predicted protein [Fibroporia radiculosa]